MDIPVTFQCIIIYTREAVDLYKKISQIKKWHIGGDLDLEFLKD